MAVRLGELLIRKGLLDADDLEQALELQRERGDKIGKILVDLGFVNPRDVLATLSEQLQIPHLTHEIPMDPWQRPYIYRYSGEHGPEPDVMSYGADGEEGGEGPNEDVVS